MAFMGGIKGLLNQQFAITIAVSVLISAFNALTLSPALSPFCFVHVGSKGLVGRFFRRIQSVVRKNDGRLRQLEPRSHSPMGIALALALGRFGYRRDYGQEPPSSFVRKKIQGYAFIQLQLPMCFFTTYGRCHGKMDDILAHTHGIQVYDAIVGFQSII